MVSVLDNRLLHYCPIGLSAFLLPVHAAKVLQICHEKLPHVRTVFSTVPRLHGSASGSRNCHVPRFDARHGQPRRSATNPAKLTVTGYLQLRLRLVGSAVTLHPLPGQHSEADHMSQHGIRRCWLLHPSQYPPCPFYPGRSLPSYLSISRQIFDAFSPG